MADAAMPLAAAACTSAAKRRPRIRSPSRLNALRVASVALLLGLEVASGSDFASAVSLVEAQDALPEPGELPDDRPVPGAAKTPTDPMMQLLDWATKNADPGRMKEVLQKYTNSNLTLRDVYGDAFDELFLDEASVMKTAIAKILDYRNASLSNDELEGALYELQERIEQVDNAMNLHRMGGLQPLFDIAASAEDRGYEIRALALWTLGIATSNNAPVQADISSINGLQRLQPLLGQCGRATVEKATDFCGKLIFVMSSIVRNDMAAQAAADELQVFDWLISEGLRCRTRAVAKKSLGALDIVLAQSPNLTFLSRLSARQVELQEDLLTLIAGDPADAAFDLDLVEQILQLVNRLLALKPFFFEDSFRRRLEDAALPQLQRCVHVRGDESEGVCQGLRGLLAQANLAFAARDLRDDEL